MHECWVCCEGEEVGALTAQGCACRGSAGKAHIMCIVKAATHHGSTDPEERLSTWLKCPTCKQQFTGEMQLELARARWREFEGLPFQNERHWCTNPGATDRMGAASGLATALEECLQDYAGGLQLHKEAQAMSRQLDRIGGETGEGINTLMTTGNIATAHMRMDNYDASLAIFLDVLPKVKSKLGDDDPLAVAFTNNLATVYSCLGNNSAARILREEALARRRRALGNDDVLTMKAVASLGNVVFDIGDYYTAFALLEEASASYKRVLGPDHPDTLEAHNKLDQRRERAQAEGMRCASGTIVGLSANVCGWYRELLNGDTALVLGYNCHCALFHVQYAKNGPRINLKPANIVLYAGTAIIIQGLVAAPEFNGQR